MPRVFFFILALFQCALLFCGPGDDGSFNLAAVQFEADLEIYRSEEKYWETVDQILEDIFKRFEPDFIIFPEYTGVLYTLIPYSERFSEADSFESVLYELIPEYPGKELPNYLFHENKSLTGSYIRGWAQRSADYSVSVLAGTVFIPVEEDAGQRELRNRALVFGNDGSLVYYQDKVYLTDFETGICGISPGELDAAGGFYVRGQKIYLTICRDTFFSTWEDLFSGHALLWIDIKANGVVFDQEQRELFTRALPARLGKSGADYGFTVCLTGEYMDLLWQGESSFITAREGGFRVLEKSMTADRQEILFLELPLEPDSLQ